MPIAHLRGITITYAIVGDTGPWVALTTGGRRAHDEFTGLADKLARHGFRVLLHDRRNTGASDIVIAGKDSEEVLNADDLLALLEHLGATPAFIGGSSSGSRMSLLFGLRHPHATRGLLLFRVTGGPVAAQRLPENYYRQYIRAAEQGGMPAVLQTEHYAACLKANPASAARLQAMDPADYIAVMSRWLAAFEANLHTDVLGFTDAELQGIRIPTIVIPGNDGVHSSASGRAAHRLIPGSALHTLPIEDQPVPLVPFEQWEPHEAEIASVFADFMRRVEAH